MAKKAPPKTDHLRNAIIGVIAVLVIGVVGYGILYSEGVTDGGEIAEGDEYHVIEEARRRTSGPIEITEFFSYGCIHCKNFDSVIADWEPGLSDEIVFKRVHVSYSPAVAMLAMAHLTLDQLDALEANHARIFRAIHDRQAMFRSPDAMADFVDGFGVSRDEFLRVFNSDRIRQAATGADAQFRNFGLTGVPSLVVAGRYVIDMQVGRKRSLDIAVELANRELAARNAPAGE